MSRPLGPGQVAGTKAAGAWGARLARAGFGAAAVLAGCGAAALLAGCGPATTAAPVLLRPASAGAADAESRIATIESRLDAIDADVGSTGDGPGVGG